MMSLTRWFAKTANFNNAKATGPELDVPVQMLVPEQEALSAIVFARNPIRVLEIGTCEGGSAAIIVKNLNRRGNGNLVCIDPFPQIKPEVWSFLSS
ncbi:MAG: hypothetical protein OJI67_05450, partial [Prosthecobacter sp.]|nr:hypothetical protein [Prosthecobacter sp.]